MSEITATEIAVNNYAPAGAELIELYNYNGAELLTIPQLVIAVSVRRAACLERASVVQMNMMTAGVEKSNRLCKLGDDLLAVTGNATTHDDDTWKADSAKWKNWVNEFHACGGEDIAKDLPDGADTYDKRLKALEKLAELMQKVNSATDRVAVELQTCISRRDLVYKLATTTVSHFGTSASNVANNY